MSSFVFAFTTSKDSNLVPFNADLIFRNKKGSHGARSGEYGGCVCAVSEVRLLEGNVKCRLPTDCSNVKLLYQPC